MVYKICKFFYLFFIIMIYFKLICQQLYSTIAFIIESSSDDPEKYFEPISDHDNQFQFGKFNTFYMTFVTFGLCWILISLDNLTLLIKIAGYGVWTIISYCVFIVAVFFYSAFRPTPEGKESFGELVSKMTLFSFDVGVKDIYKIVYFINIKDD